MTATERFITDAIKGGWRWNGEKYLLDQCPMDDMILRLKGSANRFRLPVQKILFDPPAWQAVGKTRGWIDHGKEANEMVYGKFIEQHWKTRLHRFIDHLADGKTIEEALIALEV
jgi:hypothetical protein